MAIEVADGGLGSTAYFWFCQVAGRFCRMFLTSVKGSVMKVTLHSTASIVLLTAAAISLSTPQKAEAKEWNMCAWEEIPRNVMKKIVQRSDYADILRRMSENCPDAAFALTNPSTVSTSDFVPKRSDEQSNDDHGDFNGFSQGGVGSGNGGNSASRGESSGGSATSDNGNSSGSSGGSSGSGGSTGGGGSSDSSGSGGSGGSSGGGSSSDGESSSAGDGSGNTDGSDDGGRGSNANNGGGNGSEGGSPGKGHGANDDE